MLLEKMMLKKQRLSQSLKKYDGMVDLIEMNKQTKKDLVLKRQPQGKNEEKYCWGQRLLNNQFSEKASRMKIQTRSDSRMTCQPQER